MPASPSTNQLTHFFTSTTSATSTTTIVWLIPIYPLGVSLNHKSSGKPFCYSKTEAGQVASNPTHYSTCQPHCNMIAALLAIHLLHTLLYPCLFSNHPLIGPEFPECWNCIFLPPLNCKFLTQCLHNKCF